MNVGTGPERDSKEGSKMKLELVFVAVTAVMSPSLMGQLTSRSIEHDELNRVYTLYVPNGYVDGNDYPLVINMHGLTSNRNQQIGIARMNAVADREGFLIAYPDAIDGDWLGGEDNVGFISNMIDDVDQSFGVDQSRVYSTGLSQGGAMSYLLAAKLPNRIAAVASVAGPLSMEDWQKLPNRPLPIMHIHGTTDNIAPYDGGASTLPNLPNVEFPAISSLLDLWSGHNQCIGEFASMNLPDAETTDNSTVTQLSNANCFAYTTSHGQQQTAEVVHFRVNGGGHTWPSGQPIPFGATNRDINASEEIWEFFSRHAMPKSVVVAPPSCDLDGNGTCGLADVDALTFAIIGGSMESRFDLNADSLVSVGDLQEWLLIAATKNGFSAPYLPGDADLNGRIGAPDLNQVALNWRSAADKWSEGDFNADGMVDARDLNNLALNWGESIRDAAARSSVPEPGTEWLSVFGVFVLATASRRQGKKEANEMR